MPLILNEIPPVLPPAVAAALAAVELDRANLNDDTTSWGALATALATAVGADQLTQVAATQLQNAYGGGPTAPIVPLFNDIPPVLSPKLFAAVQAVAFDNANLNDNTASTAALLAEAQAEVTAQTLTRSAAVELLAAYGVTYVDPVPAPPAA